MHNSYNIHSIANSYTVTDKLHRAGDHLSMTGFRQPTDCGCSSFHPTIGTQAFIISTLATLVPSHDITREFSQFSSLLSLFQLHLGLCSLRTFRGLPLCYGLDEFYQMLIQHQAHNLLIMLPQRALHISLTILRSRPPFIFGYPRVCILPSFFWKVLDLSRSFYQKEALCGTLG